MKILNSKFSNTVALAAGIAGLVWSGSATAQGAGLAKEKTVSTGSTDVTKEGFQAAGAAPGKETKDSTDLKIMAGGNISSGNSRVNALTVASDFLMRRGSSLLGARVAINKGDSAVDADATPKATVNNYQGALRYDHFVSAGLAGFLSVSARKDLFQSLVLRLNVSPGISYYAYADKDLKAWADIGYDLQYDVREQDAVDAAALAFAADAELELLEKTETRHNARIMINYVHELSDEVSVGAHLEYLQAMQDTENFRINSSAAITSQIAGDLSVAASFTWLFDNSPLPDIVKSDRRAAFTLVYTL